MKVTPKGGGQSVIVPVANRAFYQSQGASIEPATEKEILNAFPELAARQKEAAAQLKKDDKQNLIDTLRHENSSLRDKVALLELRVKTLTEQLKNNVNKKPSKTQTSKKTKS